MGQVCIVNDNRRDAGGVAIRGACIVRNLCNPFVVKVYTGTSCIVGCGVRLCSQGIRLAVYQYFGNVYRIAGIERSSPLPIASAENAIPFA